MCKFKNEKYKMKLSKTNRKVQEQTAIYFKVQEIGKLKEYKATLINSAVPGKIRVG
jgi:hypothetical protein